MNPHRVASRRVIIELCSGQLLSVASQDHPCNDLFVLLTSLQQLARGKRRQEEGGGCSLSHGVASRHRACCADHSKRLRQYPSVALEMRSKGIL